VILDGQQDVQTGVKHIAELLTMLLLKYFKANNMIGVLIYGALEY
jgi:hypothetical protein